jgi:twin arginine-targeting protein translocase, TatA/E family
MSLGPWEIAIIVLLIVLLFGAKKLPDAARSIGRSMRIFKSEVKEMKKDDEVAEQQVAPQQIEAPQPAAQPNFEQHYKQPEQPDYRQNYEEPNRGA